MTSEGTQYLQGCRLFEAGRYAEAEQLFQYCLQKGPVNADVLNALGCVYEATGQLDAAALYLGQAVQQSPENPVFHFNYGNLQRRCGQRAVAEHEYLEAIEADRSFAAAFYGLGSLYLEDEKLESAEACLQRAVDLGPNFAPALHDLGQLRLRQGLLREAELLYRQCLQVDAHFLPALNSLGMLLIRQNRLNEAQACFRQATSDAPDYLQARCNQAVLDTWRGNLDAAIDQLQYAIGQAPADGDIHYNLALALLSAGRFEEGWREYEWRFRKARPVPVRHADIPRWGGEKLAGQRILIHAEQGYGDSLQFIRYAVLLAQQGATVYVEGQDHLITPLLASVPGVSRAISRSDSRPPSIDLQLPLMSLPLVLGAASWPPLAPPYLYPPYNKKVYWRERLASLEGIKIGLAWAGRPEHDNDANRSISVDTLEPLGSVPGVSWVSLQFGNSPLVMPLPNMLDVAGEVRDFCDSAALVSGLDLVVTVDSAIAHLAGGLGRPFCLLLPWNPDWRWMHRCYDSMWYPSARMYRQSTPGQWSGVMEELVSNLKAINTLLPNIQGCGGVAACQ